MSILVKQNHRTQDSLGVASEIGRLFQSPVKSYPFLPGPTSSRRVSDYLCYASVRIFYWIQILSSESGGDISSRGVILIAILVKPTANQAKKFKNSTVTRKRMT